MATISSPKNWFTAHTATSSDQRSMAAMRGMVESDKGKLQGIAARGPFDGIMGGVAAPEGVTFDSDTVGGVAGWWCRPADAPQRTAIEVAQKDRRLDERSIVADRDQSILRGRQHSFNEQQVNLHDN
jgi:hypothetical protein